MKAVATKNFRGSLNTYFSNAGDFVAFTGRFFKELFVRPFETNEWLFQCYKTGYLSLPLVAITGFILGLVLTLQTRPSLADFGAESLLPGMVSVSLVKEIGPVITGLICAGKIGSRIGAELGAMKVTEQISAMEVSAINPYKYLVVTRVLATSLMVPLLIIFTDAIGMVGGYVAMNIHSDISIRSFFSSAIAHLDFSDIIPATIKSVFFGFAVGMIACYKGFRAEGGTESVGTAANTAVVSSSLAIFVIDMITVQINDLL